MDSWITLPRSGAKSNVDVVDVTLLALEIAGVAHGPTDALPSMGRSVRRR
jgi:hypothetical protein